MLKAPPVRDRNASAGSVARLALWLGMVGFGGGYAVLEQIRAIVVEKWRWLTSDDYADVVAIAQSLPGASGANVFTQLGLRFGGLWGASAATALFILPSALLMVAFGALYGHVRDLRQIEAVFAGMNPAVVAIVVFTAWQLAKSSSKAWQVAVAVTTTALVELQLLGVFEVVLLGVVGGLTTAVIRRPAGETGRPPTMGLLPIIGLAALLPTIALVFLRLGLAMFGGGLAMIPVLDHEVVDRLGWLTPREFSDAVTLGQITPGPVAITATFVGYRVAGASGAMTATLAAFLPAFVLNVIAGRSVAAWRRSPMVDSVFLAVKPVVIGVILAAALSLGRNTLHEWPDYLVATLSLVALAWLRTSALLVLIAAATVRGLASLY